MESPSPPVIAVISWRNVQQLNLFRGHLKLHKQVAHHRELKIAQMDPGHENRILLQLLSLPRLDQISGSDFCRWSDASPVRSGACTTRT